MGRGMSAWIGRGMGNLYRAGPGRWDGKKLFRPLLLRGDGLVCSLDQAPTERKDHSRITVDRNPHFPSFPFSFVSPFLHSSLSFFTSALPSFLRSLDLLSGFLAAARLFRISFTFLPLRFFFLMNATNAVRLSMCSSSLFTPDADLVFSHHCIIAISVFRTNDNGR